MSIKLVKQHAIRLTKDYETILIVAISIIISHAMSMGHDK